MNVLIAITVSFQRALNFLRSVTNRSASGRRLSFSQSLIPQDLFASSSYRSLNSFSQPPSKDPVLGLFTLSRNFSASGSMSTIVNESLWSFFWNTLIKKSRCATNTSKECWLAYLVGKKLQKLFAISIALLYVELYDCLPRAQNSIKKSSCKFCQPDLKILWETTHC